MDCSVRLKAVLEAKNLRQIQLSEFGEVTQASVSRYLSGRSLDSDFIVSLKKNLNVNPLWLLTGEGEMFLNEQRQIQVQDAKRMIQEQMQARLRERENPKLAKLIEKLGLLNEENLASVTGYVDALLEKEKKHG